MARSKTFYRVAFATAFVFYATTFFWLADGWLPGVLGLLLLPVIIWAADALGIPQRMRDLTRERPHSPRKYVQLRSRVDSLLDLAKRVNWLAVDMDRGIRTAADVEEELDKAVERMKGLVDEIREAAGKASDDPDVVSLPDPGPPVPVDPAPGAEA
jgi:hypothetical protein